VAVLDDGEWLDLDSDPGAGEYDEMFEPVIAGTGVLYPAFGDANGDPEPTDEDISIEQHAIIGWQLPSVAGCQPAPITATGWDLQNALLTAVMRPDGELHSADASYQNLAETLGAAENLPPKPKVICGFQLAKADVPTDDPMASGWLGSNQPLFAAAVGAVGGGPRPAGARRGAGRSGRC